MDTKLLDSETASATGAPAAAPTALDAGSPSAFAFPPASPAEEELVERWQRAIEYGTPDSANRRREHLIYAAVKQGGALAAIAYIALQPTGWVAWSGFAVFYVLNILSMSLGYHRYFTHKAFETSLPMRYVLAALAQFGTYGSLKRWCADHRRHHAFSDQPGDIHSPSVGNRGEALAGRAGLKHAHLGWAYDDSTTNMALYGKGIVGDPVIEWAHRTRYFWFFMSIVGFPVLWGLAFGGWAAVLPTLMVAGFLRGALALHAIAAVNSIGHVYGYQNFKVADTSRNNLILGYLTLGEGWHNNHHAHARAASNHVRWWEIDPTAWIIRGLEMAGLVWNVQWKNHRMPFHRDRFR